MADAQNSKTFQYLVTCIGNIICFTNGLLLGWSSPIVPKLQDAALLKENPFDVLISNEEASNVASLLNLGAVIGPPIAGYLADKWGRKKSLICAGVLIAACNVSLIFNSQLEILYLCRFVSGMGMGSVFSVYPMYMGEISETSIRGKVLSAYSCFTAAGILTAYIVGPYVSYTTFAIIISAFPCVFVVTFQLLAPESPIFLLLKGKEVEAEKSMTMLRSNVKSVTKRDLKDIKAMLEESKSEKMQISEVLKSHGLRKAMLMILMLTIFQQLSGIIIVLFYSQVIFETTGTNIAPEVCTIIIGGVQLIASCVTPLVIEILGRKKMLIFSGIGMAVFEATLGTTLYLQTKNVNIEAISWMPILCLVAYMVFYNVGFGPIPWTFIGEVFSNNWKAIASTITISFTFLQGYVLAKFFTSVTALIGMYGAFWFFAGSTLIGSVFVHFCVIETKGKTFQQIQNELQGKSDNETNTNTSDSSVLKTNNLV